MSKFIIISIVRIIPFASFLHFTQRILLFHINSTDLEQFECYNKLKLNERKGIYAKFIYTSMGL